MAAVPAGDTDRCPRLRSNSCFWRRRRSTIEEEEETEEGDEEEEGEGFTAAAPGLEEDERLWGKVVLRMSRTYFDLRSGG